MDVVIDREYRGDFVEIKDSLNLIIDKLNENFAEIANASDQVSSGANQISDGSQAEMLKEMVCESTISLCIILKSSWGSMNKITFEGSMF